MVPPLFANKFPSSPVQTHDLLHGYAVAAAQLQPECFILYQQRDGEETKALLTNCWI